MPEKFLEKEQELTPEVSKAREFFIDQLSVFTDKKKLQQASVQKLFKDYKNYINSDIVKESIKADKDKYRKYLLYKLPKKIQKRNKEKSIEELEKIHNNRQEVGCKMILGFHVSDQNIPETETIKESYSESIFKNATLPRGAYVQYSDDPHYLWNIPTPQRYFYLVEGSEDDKKTTEKGWRARPVKEEGLTILAKFYLTKELEDALNLKFASGK